MAKKTKPPKTPSKWVGPSSPFKASKLLDLLKSKRRGKLITVEGLDRCGKSTLITSLSKRLTEAKIPFKVVEMFPKSSLQELVEWNETFTPLQRTLLMKLNADQARIRVSSALEEDVLVICEGGGDTFMAYQGFGEDLLPEVWTLDTLFEAFPIPDLTLFLDIPVSTAAERHTHTHRRSVFEFQKNTKFLSRAREGFRYIGRHFPRVKTLDATLAPEHVLSDALIEIDVLLQSVRQSRT